MNIAKAILLKWIDPPLPKLEVYCRICKGWHPVDYGTNTRTGKEENLIMGAKCGETVYLVGVAGQAIDGHQIRKAK